MDYLYWGSLAFNLICGILFIIGTLRVNKEYKKIKTYKDVKTWMLTQSFM